MSDLRIEAMAYGDPVAVELVQALNAEVEQRYAADPDDIDDTVDRAAHNVLGEDVAPPVGAFLVAWRNGEAVGCGAVRRRGDGTAELKRMYVAPSARGRGIARALLGALEDEAARLGYRRLILETGTRQHEAMALYVSAGWTPIPNYGPYRLSPLSRCYEKLLGSSR